MTRRCLMAAVALLDGCAQQATIDVDSPPPVTDTNFARLSVVLAGVTSAGEVFLYEGLPSEFWEPELRARELKEKETITIRGYPFYDGTLALPAASTRPLTELLSTAKSFAPYTSQKKCGLFNPEFCLEWKTSEATTQALICLECGEVKLYGPNVELHCDLSSSAAQQLKQFLSKVEKE
jgi:hypothetical protein